MTQNKPGEELASAVRELFDAVAEALHIPQLVEWLSKRLP